MVYKCINCIIHNKHNPSTNISVDHSSVDKKCPSMQAIIETYRLNTEWRIVKIPMLNKTPDRENCKNGSTVYKQIYNTPGWLQTIYLK